VLIVYLHYCSGVKIFIKNETYSGAIWLNSSIKEIIIGFNYNHLFIILINEEVKISLYILIYTLLLVFDQIRVYHFILSEIMVDKFYEYIFHQHVKTIDAFSKKMAIKTLYITLLYCIIILLKILFIRTK
jgi:hypothetical protein